MEKTPLSLDIFTAKWRELRDGIGFHDIADTLGLVPYAATESTITMRMPWAQSISQATSVLSAAALFGLCDVTGTLLALLTGRDGTFPLCVQSSINFLGNTKSGDAFATATVLRSGRKIAVCTVVANDADGNLLVSATFTYAVV
jgi:uncharacterized protein (TIGR00369 family)